MAIVKKLTTNMLVFMAMAVGLNFAGCFVALVLKLPVYLDSMGTLLSAVLMGPAAGAAVGGLTALINGATIDPVSLYFLPVQVVAGVSTGLLFKSGRFEGLKSVLAIVLVTLFVSVMSSVIVAFVFNGVTSSGSSLIVAVLKNSGINIVASVFSTQIVTDLLDKAICFSVVFGIIKVMPVPLKNKLVKHY